MSIVDGGNPLAVARDAHAHWGRLADIFEVHMRRAAALRRPAARHGRRARVGRPRRPDAPAHRSHRALGHFPNAPDRGPRREAAAAPTLKSPTLKGYVRADIRARLGSDRQPN